MTTLYDEPVTMLYAVNHWGSKPGTKDDCYGGSCFATKEEALIKYNQSAEDYSVEYIEIDGPDIHKERKNPIYNKAMTENYGIEWAHDLYMSYSTESEEEHYG